MDDQSLLQQLQEELEACLGELRKKDSDLKLAAEIGQTLVVSNQKLSEEVASLLDSNQTIHQALSKLESLELSNKQAVVDYENSMKENDRLRESVRTCKDQVKKSHDDARVMAKDLGECQDLLKAVCKEKADLVNEKTQLLARTLDLVSIQSKLESKLKTIIQERDEKKCVLQEMIPNTSILEYQVKALETEIMDLKNNLKESESILDSYQGYRDQFHEQSATIEKLSSELEWTRESNQLLVSRLSILEPGSDAANPEDTGGKSLLSEIEERRLQLIKVHEILAQKHAGLEESHSLSLFRQQKMKHHIARLSQLSTTEDIEKTRMLEEALTQCESEKLELERHLDLLLAKKPPSYSHWDDDQETLSDGKLVQTLEFRVNQLMEECDSLRKMNQTLRLVKAAETDKLHQTNSSMLEKERELDQLRKSFANTRFELDELRLSQSCDRPVVTKNTREKEDREWNKIADVDAPSESAEIVIDEPVGNPQTPREFSNDTFKPPSRSKKSVKLDRSLMQEKPECNQQ
jgi:hypothetical protein